MQEESLMIAVPENTEDLNPRTLINRLVLGENVKLVKYNQPDEDSAEDEGCLKVRVSVQGREYDLIIAFTDLEIPEFFRTMHFFSDLDFEKIDKMETGLIVEIAYSDDFQVSYHDQLKVIDCLLPNCLAVLDIPSEKILSGKWVKLAAESKIPPAPRYLFTVQAISGEGDEVWLHSHGLRRLGLPDLEILGSDVNLYNSHYPIIENIALRMMEKGEEIPCFDAEFLAWLTDDVALVATLVELKEGLKHYPNIQLGTMEERDEYHSEDTRVILLYLTPADEKNHRVSPIQTLNEYIEGNPIYMISNEETLRMSLLARERISYVKNAFGTADTQTAVLLKIGLEVDAEYQDEENEEIQREHIWFELKEIKNVDGEDVFVCELTQEPYYISAMHEGDMAEFSMKDITDWLIFSGERKYTPDDAYLL